MRAFAVRWTGTITPPGPGDYTFNVTKPDCWPCEDKESFRVYLDGHLVLEGIFGEYGKQGASTTFQAHFTDQRPHPFRLEYVHEARLWAAGITLNWQPPVEVLREEAVNVAKQADVVVAFVGLSPDLEGEEMSIHVPGFEGGDRTDIALPGAEKGLLEALGGLHTPLVVVLMNGSALAVNWAQDHAEAVLEAWYPGEEGGTAIAETLAGINNPAGRLPITFYASLDQLPPFDDYSMQNRTYRYFQGKPLYAFGSGLSYSTFQYSSIRVSRVHLTAGGDLTVEADIRNTSAVAGDEVAELYLEFPSLTGAPRLALRGFERCHVDPGTTHRLSFTLKPRDLSMVNDRGEHVVAPGTYHIFVGGAQPGDTTAGVGINFEITGEAKLPR
jgi:beta-glucosidase